MATAGTRPETGAQARPGSFLFTDSRARTLLLAVLLIVITVLVYLPIRNNAFFSLDDRYYVIENEHVHHGLDWTTLHWAFTSLNRANWIPLSFLSHAIDYQLFGDDPAGHHLVSVLLHAINAALLFWVLKRATGYTGRSFMVAALFALHPLNVEGVAWLAERKTILSMLFFLLALGAYQWYAGERRESRYWLVGLLFALGLSAKSQIITLPCVLLLWDFWPLQRMSLGQEPSPEAKLPPLPEKPFAFLMLEKAPLLLIAAFVSLLTVYSEAGAHPRLWAPLSQRLANAIYSYGQYLEKAFWPSNMAPMYPNRGATVPGWEVAVAGVILVAITCLALAGRRHRYLPVGWFLFLGTLVPMLQIFQFGFEGMADRFAYQALIGLFIMVCWGVSDWAAQRHMSIAWLAGSGALVLLALTLVTERQITFWKDPATMWRHALAVVPDDWVAESQMGREMFLLGRTDEGMQHFRRAVALNPYDGVSNIGIAVYEQQHGNLQAALDRYQSALRDYSLVPHDAAAIYTSMGAMYRSLGETAKAEECFAKAAELRKKAAK